MVRQNRPDLAVIDVSLKGGSGLELCKHLASVDPPVRMLVVSAHDEALYAERALRAGASGYISKNVSTQMVLEAIRRVLDGHVWVSDATENRLLASVARGVDPGKTPIEILSDRELEILELMGHGLTTHQIADRLHLSPKTVESYRESLKRKLGLRNSVELTRQAVQWVLENR